MVELKYDAMKNITIILRLCQKLVTLDETIVKIQLATTKHLLILWIVKDIEVVAFLV